MTHTDKTKYIGSVSKKVSEIYLLYTDALSLQAHSPSEAIHKARETTMAIIERLLGSDTHTCNTLGFETCLQKMLRMELVPAHIKVAFKGVFEYSRLVEEEDQQVDFVAIQPCLQELSNIVRWYFREFEKMDKIKITQILGPEVSPDLYKTNTDTLHRDSLADAWKKYNGIVALTFAEMLTIFIMIVSRKFPMLDKAFYAPPQMNEFINFFEGTLGYPAVRIGFTLFFLIVPMLFTIKFKKYLDKIETSGQNILLIIAFFNLVAVLTIILVFWLMHFLEKITVYF